MSKDSNSTRMMVRLSGEDAAWIETEADMLGLDASSFMRMLVRQRRNNISAASMQAAEVPIDRPRPRPALPPQIQGAPTRILQAAPAPEPEPEETYYDDDVVDDDFEVPADADGGIASNELAALMGLGVRQIETASREYKPLPKMLAGSYTRPAGVANTKGAGHHTGDGVGNVVRENYRHLGFKGGGSR